MARSPFERGPRTHNRRPPFAPRFACPITTIDERRPGELSSIPLRDAANRSTKGARATVPVARGGHPGSRCRARLQARSTTMTAAISPAGHGEWLHAAPSLAALTAARTRSLASSASWPSRCRPARLLRRDRELGRALGFSSTAEGSPAFCRRGALRLLHLALARPLSSPGCGSARPPPPQRQAGRPPGPGTPRPRRLLLPAAAAVARARLGFGASASAAGSAVLLARERRGSRLLLVRRRCLRPRTAWLRASS